MKSTVTNLNASEAANRLGVSTKALMLYEQKSLVNPRRSAAGYRVYSADDMVRAANVVALRNLGLNRARLRKYLQENLKFSSSLWSHMRHLSTKRSIN